MHRDLKPENILIEYEPESEDSITDRKMIKCVKITDFGLSKLISSKDPITDSCGTPAYVAPEILHKQPYFKEIDIWSLGVIFYYMVSKMLPFHAQEKAKTFKLIKTAEPDFSLTPFQYVSHDCVDLISCMLTKEPEYRISSKDALNHSFFDLLGSRYK